MPRAKLNPDAFKEYQEKRAEDTFNHTADFFSPRYEGHGCGYPSWVPTPEQRRVIQRLSGVGMPQEQIATLFGVAIMTLKAHCEEDMKLGVAMVNGLYLNKMYQEIMVKGNTRLLEFWARARLRWSTPNDPVPEGAENFGDLSDDELRAELDAVRSRASVASRARDLAPAV